MKEAMKLGERSAIALLYSKFSIFQNSIIGPAASEDDKKSERENKNEESEDKEESTVLRDLPERQKRYFTKLLEDFFVHWEALSDVSVRSIQSLLEISEKLDDKTIALRALRKLKGFPSFDNNRDECEVMSLYKQLVNVWKLCKKEEGPDAHADSNPEINGKIVHLIEESIFAGIESAKQNPKNLEKVIEILTMLHRYAFTFALHLFHLSHPFCPYLIFKGTLSFMKTWPVLQLSSVASSLPILKTICFSHFLLFYTDFKTKRRYQSLRLSLCGK